MGGSGGLRGVTAGGCSPQRRGQGQWRHPRAQGIGAANPVPLQGFGSRRPPRCSLQELRKAQSGSASWGQSIFVQRLVLCSHEGVQPADPTGETPQGRPPLKQHRQQPACAGLGTRQALMVLS